MNDLAVVILTYNEEKHIARALKSVAAIASQIFVIDSFSSDGTVEISRSLGAVVLQNKFTNQSKQFQWGLDNAPITACWILKLDADEIIEDDLVDEIKSKLPSLSDDIVGINLKRKHIFMGRWVRFGGRYPLILLRIWRRGKGRIEDRWMDEHVVAWGGRIVTFDGGFSDCNLNDLTFFTDKHNKYATREAIDVLGVRLGLFERDTAFHENVSSFQVIAKRLIKERIYNRIPFFISSTGYFFWRYFLQLGFLDGKSGLIYHFLQGYWYRFLVGAKLTELERAVSHLKDKGEIRREITRLTGFKVDG